MLINNIIEPSLQETWHILNDTFNFVKITEKDLEIETVLGVADIKSLYTNILHHIGLKALGYWIEELQKVEHLQGLTKSFILKGMSITLNYINFYFNGGFINHIKGTGMGTYTAVLYANFTCGYLEFKLFNKLPEISSYDLVKFFLKNVLDPYMTWYTVGIRVLTFYDCAN